MTDHIMSPGEKGKQGYLIIITLAPFAQVNSEDAPDGYTSLDTYALGEMDGQRSMMS